MEGLPNSVSSKQEHGRDIPKTLPGLLNMLVANGKLAEFAAEAEKIGATVQNPAQKTAALAELAERYTKE